jgi:fructan beta-fructosidase
MKRSNTVFWRNALILAMASACSFVLADAPMVKDGFMEIKVEKRYLNLPVKTGADKRYARLLRNDEVVREFDIELSDSPDFWVFLDLQDFQGESLRLHIDEIARDEQVMEKIVQSDAFMNANTLYQEKYRPQFHFSPMRGWNNDPNGMVYYDGEYHLFFQHNPFGWNWGNMTWGHAVSTDLVHWTELGDALHPDELGTIFSGSAVIDYKNTTGFQTGDTPPMVCIYTYAGDSNQSSKGKKFTQGLAYSNDRGRTWTKYTDNPVQGHIEGNNRDPKVIWDEAAGHWVIVLYLEHNRFAFFTSKDLKQWEKQSELESFYECPELFTLDLNGDAKWILYGGAGEYFIGDFDGKKFTPETEALPFNYGNCFYASQTFNNIPAEDGRRIQIGWGRTGEKSMPFNQMMDFPVELTLRDTDAGPRIFTEPVKAIALLHGDEKTWKDIPLAPGDNPLADTQGELLHIRARIEMGTAKEITFNLRGIPITYDGKKLCCLDKEVKIPLKGQPIELEFLVDRLSIEIFAQQGRYYMPMGMVLDTENTVLQLTAKGGTARIQELAVYPLASAWKR